MSKGNKVNRWQVTGYVGWDDYDGPSADNIYMTVEVETFFTKDDILAALRNHYKNERVTSFNLKKIPED